jgi:glycosyltransferase involved in cell wall biosynthesis
MTNELLLFTHSFPYGNGEQFLETEIVLLAQQSKKVYIAPSIITEHYRALPSNCEIIVPQHKFELQHKLRYYLAKHFYKVMHIYLVTLFKTKQKKIYVLDFKNKITKLIYEVEKSNYYYTQFKDQLQQVNTIYFYWFLEPVLHFCILKSSNKVKQAIVVRTHGYDYDHLQGEHYYFREFELNYINHLLPVSNYGKNYFTTNYNAIKIPVEVAYLGVNSYGLNPLSHSAPYTLVSCSAFHKVKRVHKIIEILSHINEPVTWVHFGMGELEFEIKQLATKLPKNITVKFMGQVSNQAVINYYKNEPVSLFINVSELEGIPVSIMEAISFGIPAIGCNTCGVPEIVNENTGFLIDKEFDAKTVATVVLNYLHSSTERKNNLKNSTYNFWNTSFNAQINYSKFIQNYLS